AGLVDSATKGARRKLVVRINRQTWGHEKAPAGTAEASFSPYQAAVSEGAGCSEGDGAGQQFPGDIAMMPPGRRISK
ncbi:hypothetical protein, partial [Ensifer aridi]|uniref:hypothetical protein n=1 Tax=Ensifer aridi TaxID=1708715 RepID=UPI001AEC765E